MAHGRNFFARAFDALIAGRERQAQRYVVRYERAQDELSRKLTKR